MKGHNRLELNKATMLEAMQLWLDANFKNPPRAADIGEAADVFRLRVIEAPEEQSK